MTTELVSNKDIGFNLVPTNNSEAWEIAKMLADSDMVPKDYKGKPANVLVAAAMGAELGLPPVQALQNIAVINGRPSLWGDALIGLVRSHPKCEDIAETFDEDTMTASCVVKRKGQSPVEATFSQADAKAAGLWGKTGPWSQYPKRMLKLRARGFALRDAFADVLKGVAVAEEQQDIIAVQGEVVPKDEPPAKKGTAALKERMPPPTPDGAIDFHSESAKLRADFLSQITAVDTVTGAKAIGEAIAGQADTLREEDTDVLRNALNIRMKALKKAEAEAAKAAKSDAAAAFDAYADQIKVLTNADSLKEMIDLVQNDKALTAEQRDKLAGLIDARLGDEDVTPF